MTNFRQYYFQPQEQVRDLSKRTRIRLGSYIKDILLKTSLHYEIAAKIAHDLGIKIDNYVGHYDFETFFNESDKIDFLSALTSIYNILTKKSSWEITQLRSFTNNCFREEGTAYEMNENGEVRYIPDEEFEKTRILTLKNLSGDDLGAVLAAFNKAYTEFQKDISEGKHALRDIFEANEILFIKIVAPKHNFNQLNTSNIMKAKNFILVDIMKHSDEVAKLAANKLLESYKDWVDGIHPYRHGQNVDTYNNPPDDFTILALSNGASFLRWLASIYKNKP